MADAETRFVETWTDWWGNIPVPSQLAVPGAVRRLDIGALLGKAMPQDDEAGVKLLEGIARDLRTLLADKDGALFWSPAPGLVDVFYPKLLPQAADLMHSVARATVERRVREVVVTPAAAKKNAPAASERRVDWETFQKVCRQGQARPEQIQTIDVSELILGAADPKVHLSRRAWQLVDGIIDEFIAGNGYCTRYTGNLVLLFFPGVSVSLARLKRRAIASDIESLSGKLGKAGRTAEEEATGAESDDIPVARRGEADAGQTPEEIAAMNKAFAAMAAASGMSGLTPAELTIPETVLLQMVPVWRAENQALVGHAISIDRSSLVGPDDERLDMPVLARAQADLLQSVESRNPYLIFVPVHWRTLERSTTRSKYIELAARLPEELRRYIVTSLHDVPEDLMAARIEDCIRDLRRFSRAVVCQVDLDRRDFGQFVGVPLNAIGIDLAGVIEAEDRIMAGMNQFLDAAAPLKVMAFIKGLKTKSLVIAALAAGFDFLSGAAIATETGTMGIRAFSIPDLYGPAESLAPAGAAAPAPASDPDAI